METLKNKLCAIGLLACGSVPALVVNDATALVVIGMIAVPLFFAKENWVYLGIGPRQGLFPFIFALISQVLLRRTMLMKGDKGAWTK